MHRNIGPMQVEERSAGRYVCNLRKQTASILQRQSGRAAVVEAWVPAWDCSIVSPADRLRDSGPAPHPGVIIVRDRIATPRHPSQTLPVLLDLSSSLMRRRRDGPQNVRAIKAPRGAPHTAPLPEEQGRGRQTQAARPRSC